MVQFAVEERASGRSAGHRCGQKRKIPKSIEGAQCKQAHASTLHTLEHTGAAAAGFKPTTPDYRRASAGGAELESPAVDPGSATTPRPLKGLT